jgi:uncharacterized protein
MMTLYDLMVPTYLQMLRNLSGCLTKAAAHAQANNIDPAELVEARLAPDMFPLSAQVLFSCVQALGGVASLTGGPRPEIGDPDKTLDAMQARISATVAALEAVPASAFDGAAERTIEIQGRPGAVFVFTGDQFVRDWALPQFYFHLMAAYANLRHKGVDLGKADYVTHAAAYRRMVEA